MPQPLTDVAPNASWALGQYPFAGNPKLATLALAIIAGSSNLEGDLASVLVQMLGAKANPAIAMYTAIVSTSARVAAARAAAKDALSEQQWQSFELVLKLVTSVAKGRNRIAHWIWGTSPDIPLECVLLCPPNVSVEWSLWFHDATKYGDKYIDNLDALNTKVQKRILVYRTSDFKDLYNDIEQTRTFVRRFGASLIDGVADKVPEVAQLYDDLCNHHRIQKSDSP